MERVGGLERLTRVRRGLVTDLAHPVGVHAVPQSRLTVPSRLRQGPYRPEVPVLVVRLVFQYPQVPAQRRVR